ncbi:Glyoxalase/Bleomycin resistance protein/Dihydroxybiphenyl dioxygenase [Exophiala viscosa]|uniref:Glyoxalase/Bleomycin resistance protein/Dihydroxybiphenyl dioxygenase n=1 Tax=Exophiala viscosa TaxID=2486360 RepID=UPI00219568C1|nr:Glyoxalase/Bleomycin resistance protein/Dihydroxybiphenyl dioxygenase [Exophiala viscosa]
MGAFSESDFDAVGGKVLSPSTLAHVVLRTSNSRKMVEFYVKFLGGTITFGNDFISFVTYDEEHHRIALINIPGSEPKAHASGLEHIAFTFPTLSALLLAHRQRKALGIFPFWCVNHGPTTSVYYKDPDGNKLETQVDNFPTVEEANEFMNGSYFAENPIGTDFDAEELLQKIKEEVPDAELKRRVEIGPRALPDLGSM